MKNQMFAACVAALFAVPATAEMIVTDGYARSANGKTGAGFMRIENTGAADRLVNVTSDAAVKVELHTHRMSDDGVMSMVHVEEGFALSAGDTLVLERGGHHVMFMGLKTPWAEGDTVPVTLRFEGAGAVEIDLPVDLSR